MSEFIRVGPKKDFPENRTTATTVGDRDICIANSEGSLHAFDDGCTHAQSLLSSTNIEDGILTCPLHGAKFDITTGAAKALPATESLKMHEVKVEGEDVLVKING